MISSQEFNYILSMKNFFLTGFLAFFIGMVMTSCMQELNYEEQEQKASLDNAQQTLGFYIPQNQDWVMSTTINTDIPIDIKDGETYSVKVYSNDPLMEGFGYVLAKETVVNGHNFTTSFRVPSYKGAYCIGITNSDNQTIYRTAYLEDGKLTEFLEDKPIETEKSETRTRAITVDGDTYDVFNAPTSEELNSAFPQESDIPNSALEIADLTGDLYFVYKDNNNGRNYKITKPGEVTIGGSWNNDYDKAKANNVYVNVNGNVTIKRNGSEFINLYIIKGNVTLDSNFGECGGIISVASGATFNDTRDHLAHNGGIKLYNRGTVNTTQNYDIGNKAAVYNEGLFTTNAALSYSAGVNNTSFFINMGSDAVMTAQSMTLNSTCHFLSEGTVNISGETAVTQKDIIWVNNGHYTTGSMKFSAHNGTFYNYCQLIVKNNCSFLDGKFNMMDNSYAEFGTGLFNNFYVVMGKNSGINIKNGSKWGRQGAGNKQGFYAKDDQTQAFVRLGGETYIPDHNGAAFHVSGEKLVLAYERIKFFNNYNDINLYSGYSDINYWSETNAEKLRKAQSGNITWNTHNVTTFLTSSDFDNVTVKTVQNQCAANWTVPGVSSIIEENQTWTYTFEDNKTRCDFDLNDVVIQVRESENDASKLIVKLMAAGCEFDNYVWLGQTPIVWANGAEVHEAFGADHGVMINTGNNRGIDMDPVEVVINKPSGFDFQNADFKIRPFKINSDPTVEKNAVDGFITIKKQGVDTGLWGPLGLAIPAKWKWPNERNTVNYAYPEFTAWGKEADLTLRSDLGGWYENPTPGLVYE